jgi:hypothetical protein
MRRLLDPLALSRSRASCFAIVCNYHLMFFVTANRRAGPGLSHAELRGASLCWMSAIDIDELAQKLFGVHCCCSTNIPTALSRNQQANPSTNGRTEIETEQSVASRCPTPAYQSSKYLNTRFLDAKSRKITPQVYELKNNPDILKSSDTLSRRSAHGACVTAENALVGMESYPASGSLGPRFVYARGPLQHPFAHTQTPTVEVLQT